MAKDKRPAAKELEDLGREDRADDPLFVPHLEHETLREAIRSLRTSKPESDEYSVAIETICGAIDDSQPVEQYNGTLGVTQAFVNAHQAPVGQLQWNNNLAAIYTNPGTVSGVRWCTGTLISNDLFISAGHCFDQTGGGWERPRVNGTSNIISNAEIATRMHVNFNFQVDPAGNPRPEQSFPILALLEYRLGGLDFAITRLGGNPGTVFGFTGVSTTDAAVGDMICIIGHPAGMMKRIEAGPCTSLTGNTIAYNDIDTLGGNSGSGILRASDGLIVGVHTNGGCNAAGTGSNTGVRITSIRANSPTLQTLSTGTPNKFIDDVATVPSLDIGGAGTAVKALDDPTTIKVGDDGGTPNKFIDDVATVPSLDIGGAGTAVKALDDPITIKVGDDGGTPNKFIDDVATAPSLDIGAGTAVKAIDDGITIKAGDDGRTPNKFIDDGITIKVADDGGTAIKFADDGGTSKRLDDQRTIKLVDDGGQTIKFADDGGSLKAFDDAKAPALDKGFSDNKLPGSDGGPFVDPGFDPRLGGGVRPFVLATPHHSQQFVSPMEQQRQQQSVLQQAEMQIAALEQQIAGLHDELQRLDAIYRQALDEYGAMTGQTR
jgi:V8-like Glu-specific endopeptidase